MWTNKHLSNQLLIWHSAVTTVTTTPWAHTANHSQQPTSPIPWIPFKSLVYCHFFLLSWPWLKLQGPIFSLHCQANWHLTFLDYIIIWHYMKTYCTPLFHSKFISFFCLWKPYTFSEPGFNTPNTISFSYFQAKIIYRMPIMLYCIRF